MTGDIIRARVLILTMHAEEEYLTPALEAGVAGYLVKTAADRESIVAVRAIANGDLYMGPSAGRVLAKALTAKDPAKAERQRYEKLTDRESEVLRHVAEGIAHRRSGRSSSSAPRPWTRTSSASTRRWDWLTAPITCSSRYASS